ncbi:Bug family tripartite tricarboxylate transporter substrate binding protein [Skermanella stibiiresistens]|uniref:Bug family tripartite tricarboxylate transporter substrate binding protein n=1 Tax=Skermanella stibiiresistens TaxID=913326 RepID=UPI0004B09A19|nr:tripartite tricarboxylate transporter substrate binding protein [Skermanella stibiiresistens]
MGWNGIGLIRKLIAASAVSVACTLVILPAHAEIKGLEIIAPANSGGGYDQHARALQQVMQDLNLASSVQVVNVPGAGGTIGLSQFVTAKKRNPSLMIGGLGMIGAIRINKSPVTLDQVMPLALLTGEYQPLVVAADSPIKSLQDLLDKFKADPGSVSWGGFAVGSPDHILSGLVVKAAGGDVTKMNYIASGAGGELMAALLGNHITVGTGGYNEFASQLQAGKLRAIAISAPQRLPGIDVPTFKEQGLDVELVNWRAVFAKQDLKAAEKKQLDDAMAQVTASPQWKEISEQRGWINLYKSADQFAAFLTDEKGRIEGTLMELGLVN